MTPQRISIELTNQCSKHCHFCYNHSHHLGETRWQADELVDFIKDCAKSGTKAVSFGGGEPLEYPNLFEVLSELQGVLFRSITSNGLHLHGDLLEKLVIANPDKVHLSIHYPEQKEEVKRVINQVKLLDSLGIRSGINLLVPQSKLQVATQTSQMILEAGINRERIVYLPMRKMDTPTPQEMATVAGGKPFQSMTCLMQCGISSRFCSIAWDKTVAWCSYTVSRRSLPSLTAVSLDAILQNLPLVFCG
ncbi:radical SAM protein [Crocosphaera chwakensis]|uniref:Molybdenum cofactor biosynthesis protein A n=1 Tax=Crocosphaera chwakensis CCY0110 TaxID=391612 RepID=A3IWB7_9CHRO|nr:radical SAM protein [Crocosphaera chwakensis]EAZ89230.1 molybdenum cofactor biosynthesis protein A [Crocosphaera chwakensis CCY0110]